MTKENKLRKICDFFEYQIRFHDNGMVVMDDGLGIDHHVTTDILGKNYCGHMEYGSVDEAVADWTGR